MESNLKLKQGTNQAWFIYKDNQVLIGGHDKKIMDKVFEFLNHDYVNNGNTKNIQQSRDRA